MSIPSSIPQQTDPRLSLTPDALQHVERDHTRVVLTRDGQPVAALVSLHDLRALEELDEAEDAYLSRLAAEAVAQWEAEGRPAGVTHEELMARHGISPDSA